MAPPSLACTFTDTERGKSATRSSEALLTTPTPLTLAVDTLRLGLWGSHAEGRSKQQLLRFAASLAPGDSIQARIGETLCRIRRMERGIYRICVTLIEGPAAGLSVLVMPEPDLAQSSRLPGARVVFNARWCRALGLVGYEAWGKYAAERLGIDVAEALASGIDLAVDLPLAELEGLVTSADHISGRARGFVVTERDGKVVSVANAASRTRAPRSFSFYQAAGRPVRAEARLHRTYLRTHGFAELSDVTPARVQALWERQTEEYVRVVAKKGKKQREILHPLWPAAQAALLHPDVLAAYHEWVALDRNPGIEACIEDSGSLVYVDRTTGEILASYAGAAHAPETGDAHEVERLYDADDECEGPGDADDEGARDGGAKEGPEAEVALPGSHEAETLDVPMHAAATAPEQIRGADPEASAQTPPSRGMRLVPVPTPVGEAPVAAVPSPGPQAAPMPAPKASAKKPLTPAQIAAKKRDEREMFDAIDRRCRGGLDAFMRRFGYYRRGRYYMKEGAKSVRVRDAEEYWLRDRLDFENPRPKAPSPFKLPWESRPALVQGARGPDAKRSST